MHTCAIRALAILLLVPMWASAAGPPATNPATRAAAPRIGEMRQQTLAPMVYLCCQEQTSFPKLAESIGRLMPRAEQAIAGAKVRIVGPCLFRYEGLADPGKPFTLQVGYAVAPDTQAPEGFRLLRLEAFSCAGLLYTGEVNGISAAYDRLFGAVRAAGLRPGEELREYYLYWEGAESSNNIVHVAVGTR